MLEQYRAATTKWDLVVGDLEETGLEGCILIFGVKGSSQDDDTAALVLKSTPEEHGIDVITVAESYEEDEITKTRGRATVTIAAVDTAEMPRVDRSVRYEVKLRDALGNLYILEQGDYKIIANLVHLQGEVG